LLLNKAREVGPLESDIFRVEITFYQAKSRYLSDRPEIPREDRGDLDNMIKRVLDGLGPIIGFRKKWKKIKGEWNGEDSDKPKDSAIIELVAKKVNSGSEKEFVDVVVETL